jgi:hypothetical protein
VTHVFEAEGVGQDEGRCYMEGGAVIGEEESQYIPFLLGHWWVGMKVYRT